MAVGFIDLPDDILLSINEAVCLSSRPGPARTVSRLDSLVSLSRLGSTSGRHVLIPLSMTCSRLRALCLPAIFRVLGLYDDTGEREFQAPDILLHVRLLEVHRVPSDDVVAAIVRATTRVQEVYCRRGAKFHPMFLKLRSLNRVTINDNCVPRNFNCRGCLTSPLRAFFMMSSPPWKRFSDADLGVENAFVQSVLAQAHESLEAVVLPADSIRLSELAGISWPCLRELAICGAQPQGDFPLVRLLCMLPLLRVLTLAIAPRRGDPPFRVWPPGTELQCVPDLSRLERLTISFPQADDLIFQHLSLLDELSLRDSPRFYMRMKERGHYQDLPDNIGPTCPGPVLTCAAALRIFRLCAPPGGATLRRLELVVQSTRGHFEAELYAQIAASCPRLRHLELHRYRDISLPTWTSEARMVPVAEIIESLRAFTALRALRLNLDFPPASPFEHPAVQPREIERHATLVAATVPWLTSVAFLVKDSGDMYYWRTWTHVRTVNAAEHGHRIDSELREWAWSGDLIDTE